MDARRASAGIGLGLAIAAYASRAWASAGGASELRRLCLSTLALELAIASGTLILAAAARRGPREGLGLRPAGAGGGRLVALIAGTLGLSAVLDGLMTRCGLRDASVLSEVDALLAGAGTGDLLAAAAGLVLAPAVAEELLCRGLVQRGLAPRAGPLPAVVLAAIGFGALHLEWIQGSAAAVLGLYLGFAALRFDSIWPAILCHLLNNAVAVASGIWPLPFDASGLPGLALGSALAALGVGALALPSGKSALDGGSHEGSAPVAFTLQPGRRSDDS